MKGQWVPLDSAEVANRLKSVDLSEFLVAGIEKEPLFYMAILLTDPVSVVVVDVKKEPLGIFVWKGAPGSMPILSGDDQRIIELKERLYDYFGAPKGETAMLNMHDGSVKYRPGLIDANKVIVANLDFWAVDFEQVQKGDLLNPDGVITLFQNGYSLDEAWKKLDRDFPNVPLALCKVKHGRPVPVSFGRLNRAQMTWLIQKAKGAM